MTFLTDLRNTSHIRPRHRRFRLIVLLVANYLLFPRDKGTFMVTWPCDEQDEHLLPEKDKA